MKIYQKIFFLYFSNVLRRLGGGRSGGSVRKKCWENGGRLESFANLVTFCRRIAREVSPGVGRRLNKKSNKNNTIFDVTFCDELLTLFKINQKYRKIRIRKDVMFLN